MQRSAKPPAPPAPMQRHVARIRALAPAFTLVELLVVIGIIALLMGMLVPTVAGTRRQSRNLQCASNIRQICIGIISYSADNKGRFPSNDSKLAPGSYWYYTTSAGAYVSTDLPSKGSI